MNYWVAGGCPRNKVIVGVPTYGRSFTLVDGNNHGLGAPVNGTAAAGNYTGVAGFYSYYEVHLMKTTLTSFCMSVCEYVCMCVCVLCVCMCMVCVCVCVFVTHKTIAAIYIEFSIQ